MSKMATVSTPMSSIYPKVWLMAFKYLACQEPTAIYHLFTLTTATPSFYCHYSNTTSLLPCLQPHHLSTLFAAIPPPFYPVYSHTTSFLALTTAVPFAFQAWTKCSIDWKMLMQSLKYMMPGYPWLWNVLHNDSTRIGCILHLPKEEVEGDRGRNC